jgi:hypothetical protein
VSSSRQPAAAKFTFSVAFNSSSANLRDRVTQSRSMIPCCPAPSANTCSYTCAGSSVTSILVTSSKIIACIHRSACARYNPCRKSLASGLRCVFSLLTNCCSARSVLFVSSYHKPSTPNSTLPSCQQRIPVPEIANALPGFAAKHAFESHAAPKLPWLDHSNCDSRCGTNHVDTFFSAHGFTLSNVSLDASSSYI